MSTIGSVTVGRPVLHIQKVSGISGSERYLLGLLPQLRARAWDARMVIMDQGEPGADTFEREMLARHVPTSRIRVRGDAAPLAFARLVRLFRRVRPAVVQTHLVHGDFYGLAAATVAGVPGRISTKHGFDDFRHFRWFSTADRLVARLAHRHIAVSEGLASYLADVEGFDREKFDVIHYGIEPGEEPSPPPLDPPRLLCAARLIPIKGHHVLLHAFARAREDVPDLRLDLAGAGSQREPLQALAEKLELNGSVRFLGATTPIEPAIERSAAVIVPSLGEGFGRVALEAMERGRAVVASRVGGLGDLIVDGETGVLVPPGEPEPLAGAMTRVASEPGLASEMGAAGRRRALEHFSERLCAERTGALYEAVLAGARS